MFLHKLVKRSLYRARRAPGVLVWSAAAFTWAWGNRNLYAMRMGYLRGINTADYFLEAYPAIQEEFRKFVKGNLNE